MVSRGVILQLGVYVDIPDMKGMKHAQSHKFYLFIQVCYKNVCI